MLDISTFLIYVYGCWVFIFTFSSFSAILWLDVIGEENQGQL